MADLIVRDLIFKAGGYHIFRVVSQSPSCITFLSRRSSYVRPICFAISCKISMTSEMMVSFLLKQGKVKVGFLERKLIDPRYDHGRSLCSIPLRRFLHF